MKKMNYTLRKIHYWGAFIAAIPILIVIITGIMLQIKKQWTWVQPRTVKGTTKKPTLTFEHILDAVRKTEAQISSWEDIDRLDVRPSKGIVKIRGKNNWEIQLDFHTGEVLQIAYRRSDFIESIHDGSFFHDQAKLWVFLPSALILFVLWLTGMYLFALPIWRRAQKRKKKAKA